MGQDRLCDLALLSVEKETFDKINFNDIIDKFAGMKARKINLVWRPFGMGGWYSLTVDYIFVVVVAVKIYFT